MLLVAALVIAVAGFTVYRLHGVFGSDYDTATSGVSRQRDRPVQPKRVRLEVFGEPGATASISYLDIHAQPRHVADVPLPCPTRTPPPHRQC